MKNAFSHITHWVFDLDNTLYPPEAALFDQIEVRMTDFVMRSLKVGRERAIYLREHYFSTYGTTLSGLMLEHDVDPEPYLTEVHEISLDHLTKDPALRRHIDDLPGRKIVHTNGSRFHADRVIKARGLEGVFDAVYGIENSDFHPKPSRAAYQVIVDTDRIDTTRAAMFEDEARNLQVPHDMGMKTVLVGPAVTHDFIHHQTRDLTGFLSQIIG